VRKEVNDAATQLRSATRRAKSDVANKLVSMFLHELSRRVSENWVVRVDGEEYEKLVRQRFNNQCPYCSCDLSQTIPVIEHLDGMNRYRAGLHVPGNVLVACRRCNGEKRRDDSLKTLVLAPTGWESFLSHGGARCPTSCQTCAYWRGVWAEEGQRNVHLTENLRKLRSFRAEFPELEKSRISLAPILLASLTQLYSDCQFFAENEIASLLNKVIPRDSPDGM